MTPAIHILESSLQQAKKYREASEINRKTYAEHLRNAEQAVAKYDEEIASYCDALAALNEQEALRQPPTSSNESDPPTTGKSSAAPAPSADRRL